MSTDTIPVAPLSIWEPDPPGQRRTQPPRPSHPGRTQHAHRRRTRRRQIRRPPAHRRPRRPVPRLPPDPHRRQTGRTRAVAGLRRAVHRPLDRRRNRHHALAPGRDRRTDRVAAGPQDAQDHPRPGLAGLPRPHRRGRLLLRHRRHPRPAERIQRLQPRHRRPRPRPGIIPVEATQRPSADIIPTSLRDLFGYRWAFRCSTEATSDTILGHGWANMGYSATEIDPQARGVSWLRAEDGIPRRVKAAYLTDSTSSTLPPGPPRPAPPTTPRPRRQAGTSSRCTAR